MNDQRPDPDALRGMTQKTEQGAFDQQIKRTLRVLYAIFIFVVLFYIWQFHSQPLSILTDTWGQFGSFIGGLLSPLVSFAAFYWVMQSVQLQHKQLMETRDALDKAEKAQQMQANHAQTSVRLSALTALSQ